MHRRRKHMNSDLIFLSSLTIQICVELDYNKKNRSSLFEAFCDLMKVQILKVLQCAADTPDTRIPSDHLFKNTTNLTTIRNWNDC